MVRSLVRLLAVAAVCGALTGAAQATVWVSDDFNSYPDGNLVGQDSWAQTGTVVTNPIQVSSGQVLLGTSGQDANKPLSSAVPHTDGSSIYTGVDVTVTSAQATGDYFLHLSDGGTSLFWQRLFVKSTTGGYLLGMLETSGTGTTEYGTQVLNLNQSYHISIAWNFVAGATNDTFSVYVDPTSTTEGSNTPYLTHTWTSTTAEPGASGIVAVNLRQGTASNAAALALDNLVVASTFGEVVPEPATLSLLALGGVAALRRRRR